MPAPLISADFNRWAEELEQRVQQLETPQGPAAVFACTQALLPAPASFINCVLRVTDLNILAASDGTNWRRQDTGAAI